MLSSIVVKVMKWGTGTGAWPGFRGYPCPPFLRTYLWSNHLGHIVQLQAIWLWLDVVSGPLLVGCGLPGRRKKVTLVMDIKLWLFGFHGYGDGYRCLGQTLRVALY